MVVISEIENLKKANISKGKTNRQYINISNKNEFYISQDQEIYKVELDVNSENNTINDITLYNGADNVVKHLKQSNITLIVTNLGVVTMSLLRNIIYFSKPEAVSIYA